MTQSQITTASTPSTDVARIDKDVPARTLALVDVALIHARAEHRRSWDFLRQLDRLPARRETVQHKRATEDFNKAEIHLATLENRKPRLVFAADWRARGESEASARLRRW